MTSKLLTTLAVAIFLLLQVSAQDQGAFRLAPFVSPAPNLIRTWNVVRPNTRSDSIHSGNALTTSRLSTEYYDGLGRTVQKVDRLGSLVTPASGNTSAPFAGDLVKPFSYDEFGRSIRDFLPYATTESSVDFKVNPSEQMNSFFTGNYSPVAEAGNTMFYQKTEYESSPLNRVLRTYGPGDSWVKSGAINGQPDRGIKTNSLTNVTADGVRQWTVINGPNPGDFGSYSSPGVYPAGSLIKTITEDEDGKQSIEFKDAGNRVILKKVQVGSTRDAGSGSGHANWACTYYIYDDLDQLRCVIQPRGVELLVVNAWNTSALNSVILREQAFRYEYDEQGRMIVKKVPGAGPVWLVYDYRDRMVLSQDENMRLQNRWLYSEYENAQNRQVSTGLVTLSGTFTQHRANAMNASSFPNYPNLAAITDELELSRTFYDDYRWLAANGNPFNSTMDNGFATPYFLANAPTSYPFPETPVQGLNLIGLVTGTRTRVLDGTNHYLFTINYYDLKGRLIQVSSQNVAGGVNITASQYGFEGKELVSVSRYHHPGAKIGGTSETIVGTRKTYDDLGRLIRVDKRINGATAWKQVSVQEYDAIGQLERKRLGIQPNGVHRTSLNYDYNIRGWLLGINRSYLTQDNPLTAFFGMDLCYDRGSLTTDFIKDYNGTIAASHWRTQGDFVPRRYRFNYDNANRIVAASFSQLESGQWSNQQVNFSIRMGDGVNIESAYDLNGNIRSMEQWGIRGVTREVIDSLRYTYMEVGNSNRLLAVQDLKGSLNSGMGDFLDRNTTSTDYFYDGNGNLRADANKGITSIVYNHLNLPETIFLKDKGVIVYTYDAAGVKLRKRVTDSTGQLVKTSNTLYLGGALFQDDSLQYIEHEEGRIRYTPGSTGGSAPFQWDYFIKDHLGNVRMVITEEFKTDPYQTLTFENTDSLQQNLQWDNRLGQAIGVGSSRIARPGAMGDAGTNGNFVMLVRRSTGSIGATKLLKVMSGDSIHTRLDYFYHSQHDTSARNTDMLNKMVQSLESTLGTESLVAEALKNSSAAISSHLLGRSDLNRLLSTAPSLNPSNPAQTAPRAYLCVLFFDEQFRFDSASSRVVPVPYTPGVRRTIDLSFSRGVPVRKNGYAYLYFTNESNELVYFDNFLLSHSRGPILEETHYYPYGMAMAGISSKAAGSLVNKKGYNGNELQNKEISDGSGLEAFDFNARTYDQQLGRFMQIDPKTDEGGQESWSPYHFGYNNPVRYGDPDGKIPIPLIAIGVKFLVGAAVEYGSQVYDNYKSGKSGTEAWKPASWGKIGLNGATSTVDPSGGIVKKIAISTATNVAESVGGQTLDGKQVTLSNTFKDVAVMTVSGKAKVDGSGAVNKLEKSADKLERVARNSPSARNTVQATEARQAAIGAQIRNDGATVATTETTESALGKKAEYLNFNSRESGTLLNPMARGVDNTLVRKPIWPKQ